jgi:hypothetical protein
MLQGKNPLPGLYGRVGEMSRKNAWNIEEHPYPSRNDNRPYKNIPRSAFKSL